MDESQFVQLLESTLQPDTERIKAATAQLNKEFYTQPASLLVLLRILTSPQQAPQLRDLAAVEARKLVKKHWTKIPDAEKPQIRNGLLQSTLNEEKVLTRHSEAHLIAAIAAIDLEDGQWADLPPFLHQSAHSQTVRHREVAVYILFTLLENMPDLFRDNLENIFSLFHKTIQDPESGEVRINTLLGLSRIAIMLDPDEDPDSTKAFQAEVPNMLAVLDRAIRDGEEDKVDQCFEVFQTLLGCESALLSQHFGDLMRNMMTLASNRELDDGYRSQAVAFLMSCIRYRKLKVQGLRIGESLTHMSLELATELGPELSSDDEDATPARSALGLLDIMSSSLPPSQVVVPLLKAAGGYLNSPDPRRRRAGILAIGMCVEGAPDFIATQLAEILPVVLRLLEDPEVRVRSAALNGVARLADDLAEDMGKEHARLIPALVKNYDLAIQGLKTPENELSLDIVRGSCNAIDSLIEGLPEEEAAKYVPDLVPRLSTLFEFDDHKVKTAAIAAVGSIAAAVNKTFIPYFESTMRTLGQYVRIKESQEDLELRGVTCDSIGKIAGAVGPAQFQPFVQPLMEASEEALHLDHPRLKETSYILWSTMAKIYEKEFSPFLNGVVKGLHECLAQDEAETEVILGEAAKDLLGTEVTVAGQKLKVAAATDEDGEYEDLDAGDEDWDDVTAVTAVAMEKEIAVEVLGDVLSSTAEAYIPYLQQTVTVVLSLVDHSYEGIRKAALGTIWRAYACLWSVTETQGLPKWKPGLPLEIQPTEDLVKLGDAAMVATLACLQDELDRSTVTDINRDLAQTLRLCGPAILAKDNGKAIKELNEQLNLILAKKHPCQQDPGEEEEADILEESSEYDWLVIDTAMDLINTISGALGSSFAQIWKSYEKPLLKYASSGESIERSSAVGTIAECIGNMGEAVAPYTSQLLKLLLHRLSDEDPETKSNAAYGVGLLCASSSSPEIKNSYGAILSKLEPLLHSEQKARILDNAAGCVSRMIMKHPDAVPVADVLPHLVELLPLKEDFDENKPVFEMLLKLYQTHDNTVQRLTPALYPVFQKVLGPPEDQLDDETRAKVQQMVHFVEQQAGWQPNWDRVLRTLKYIADGGDVSRFL